MDSNNLKTNTRAKLSSMALKLLGSMQEREQRKLAQSWVLIGHIKPFRRSTTGGDQISMGSYSCS